MSFMEDCTISWWTSTQNIKQSWEVGKIWIKTMFFHRIGSETSVQYSTFTQNYLRLNGPSWKQIFKYNTITREKPLNTALTPNRASSVSESFVERRNLLSALPKVFGRLQRKPFLSQIFSDKLHLRPACSKKPVYEELLKRMIWKHGLKYVIVYMQKLLNPGHQNSEGNLKQSKHSGHCSKRNHSQYWDCSST